MKKIIAILMILLTVLSTLAIFAPQVKAQAAYLTDFLQLTTNPPHPNSEQSPFWSPDSSKIAYSAADSSNWYRHIWVMDADGNNKTQLTFGEVIDTSGDYSPDGEKIAFARYRGAGKHDIFIMNENGTDIEQLTDTGLARLNPRWSNDGERLAYYYGGAGTPTNEIRIMNIDDRSEVTVVSSDYTHMNVYWSPDDAKLVYTMDDGIWAVDTSPPYTTIRIFQTSLPTMHVVFSQDGKYILFASGVWGEPQDLYLIDSSGNFIAQLTYDTQISSNFDWSPDGKYIAFAQPTWGAEDIWRAEIVINQPPVADFRYRGPKTSFTPYIIYAGSEVKFDAEPSYDLDGPNQNPVSYTWDFGDGSDLLTTTEEVTYHTYVVSGPYTVTLTVIDDKGATGEISKDIFINSLKWEIYFEIDYMTGHEPTDSVLEYIHGYFRDNGIYVYFFVDDEISPADPSVTEGEFWQYEATYNDIILYNDRAQDGVDTDSDWRDGEYRLKEKWILFGTKVDASWIATNPFGVTTHTAPTDQYGNYIFIADDRIYEWQLDYPFISKDEVVTCTLMHELGHSIGILNLDKNGKEIPDPWKNDSSVMADLNVNQFVLVEFLQYSHRYWKLRNMENYVI